MPAGTTTNVHLDPRARAFYVHTLATLNASGVPYLVGGAYAFARYTGIERHTKDLDLFVRRTRGGRSRCSRRPVIRPT
jgi:hypothetical protein